MCYYTEVNAVESINTQVTSSDQTIKTEAPSALVSEGVFCSCIKTARSLGVDLPRGDAKDLMPNGPPQAGGTVLLSYDEEHVAVIQAVLPKGIYVAEGNFKRCKYTERFIPYDDPHIRGFFNI